MGSVMVGQLSVAVQGAIGLSSHRWVVRRRMPLREGTDLMAVPSVRGGMRRWPCPPMDDDFLHLITDFCAPQEATQGERVQQCLQKTVKVEVVFPREVTQGERVQPCLQRILKGENCVPAGGHPSR